MSGGTDRLQAALAAEHAAIYAYGPIGSRLAGGERRAATDADAAHRRRRDSAAAILLAADERPVAAAPAYRLPTPVAGRDDALALASAVEDRVAAAWCAVLPDAAGEARALAVDALTEAAVRAASWRRSARPSDPPTVPFPGR